MADNNLDILIRFGLSKEKATEAVNELKKIETQTKATGTEGVKQEAAVKEATEKTFASKKQLKDMLKQLGHEFPILGQIGRLAMNPIVAATTAVTAALVIYKNKFDEAVRAQGGFELPDVTEDAVKRYERIAEASSKIATNVGNISRGLASAEKKRDILNAFAAGFGNKADDTAARADAANLAGVDSLNEAARLRKISGNFNPNNTAADEAKNFLPALQEDRKAMAEMLTLIASIKDGSGGVSGAMKYMATFGLASPDKKYREYQSELSQTDAQILAITQGGKRRAERRGAFEASNLADKQAADLFGKSADLGGASAGASGADLKRASEALAGGDFTQLIQNVIKIADAATEGKERTDRAIKNLEAANRVDSQRQ